MIKKTRSILLYQTITTPRRRKKMKSVGAMRLKLMWKASWSNQWPIRTTKVVATAYESAQRPLSVCTSRQAWACSQIGVSHSSRLCPSYSAKINKRSSRRKAVATESKPGKDLTAARSQATAARSTGVVVVAIDPSKSLPSSPFPSTTRVVPF